MTEHAPADLDDLSVDTWLGDDGVPVVQVDTTGEGRFRINVNDGPIWDQSAEEPTPAEYDRREILEQALRHKRDAVEWKGKAEHAEGIVDQLQAIAAEAAAEGGTVDPGTVLSVIAGLATYLPPFVPPTEPGARFEATVARTAGFGPKGEHAEFTTYLGPDGPVYHRVGIGSLKPFRTAAEVLRDFTGHRMIPTGEAGRG